MIKWGLIEIYVEFAIGMNYSTSIAGHAIVTTVYIGRKFQRFVEEHEHPFRKYLKVAKREYTLMVAHAHILPGWCYYKACLNLLFPRMWCIE